MSRTPNEEQKLAIEHKGGVLLSAGAGSGKTFVLVEHIIFLLDDLRNRLEAIEETEKLVKKLLSSIVMMTFTKKAAGEMATRLFKRVREEGEKSDNRDFWKIVEKNMNHLYVGTIHGFCHKLISNNFFPELKSNFEIIDEGSQKKKLESLFEDWFVDTRRDRKEELNRIILSHRSQIFQSVYDIFSDPDLRDVWSNSTLEELSNVNISNCMDMLIENEPWADVLSGRFDLSSFAESSSKKWYKNIEAFIAIMKEKDWNDPSFWRDCLDYYNSISTLVKTTTKDKSFEVDEQVEKIKSYRGFVRAHGENFIAYLENRDIFIGWANVFYNLFNYIEDRYDKIGGLTFSDLEYNVLKSLKENPSSISRIGENYKYIIVDEFQDTSEVQYGILKHLVNQDFGKLFCVGDLKQAIYGFRGGELGVFKSCSADIEQNLVLSKNYRSDRKIIELNNKLFDYLFKVGLGFEGHDKNSVEVVYQEYPGTDYQSGMVKRVLAEVHFDDKFSSKDIDIVEAQFLYEEIKKVYSENGTIGILYKNLGASSHLLDLMLKDDFGFTAQVKIPLNEGPLWALFQTLLEGYLSKEDSSLDNTSFISFGILSWLGCDENYELVKAYVERFFQNIETLGLMNSFETFLGNLGVSDADHEKNSSRLYHLSDLAGEDPEYLYGLMDDFGPEKVSVEFRNGENPEKVYLMTAHGSKGLEFDHVFLGGIHTNGRRVPDSRLLGKLPGSFKWKLDVEQKDYFKSPEYLIEEIISRKKDFAESKRLFYVACTRAQKSLVFIDLQNDNEGLKYSSDSWINGIRLYLQNNECLEIDTIGEASEYVKKEVSETVKPPLFQEDNLGVLFKGGANSEYGVLAEVSVTRLATLAQCPRKFYLSNICKIDEEDLRRIDVPTDFKINDVKVYREPTEDFQNKFDPRERGIIIHDAISKGIGSNLVCPLGIEEKNRSSIEYALNLLKEKNNHSFLSEIPVKFQLFGQMISGTPDLVLLPKEKGTIPEIWDFKTGKQKENSELAYWFQLFCYAIQTCDDQGLSDEDQILVALVYVDEKKFVEKLLTKSEIKEELFFHWKKLAHFNQVNLEHCSSCSFGNLCQVNP